jgi:hypothetical protein
MWITVYERFYTLQYWIFNTINWQIEGIVVVWFISIIREQNVNWNPVLVLFALKDLEIKFQSKLEFILVELRKFLQ